MSEKSDTASLVERLSALAGAEARVFVAIAGALASGKSTGEQFASHPISILFHWALFSVASLIPVVLGSKKEAFGPLTPEVELLNGRAAMIGFTLLIVIEGLKGSALF